MPVSVAAAHRGSPVESISVHVELLFLIITMHQRYIGIVELSSTPEPGAPRAPRGERAIAGG
jgi:hypothetical protein